jgi:hypothetical protein
LRELPWSRALLEVIVAEIAKFPAFMETEDLLLGF